MPTSWLVYALETVTFSLFSQHFYFCLNVKIVFLLVYSLVLLHVNLIFFFFFFFFLLLLFLLLLLLLLLLLRP